MAAESPSPTHSGGKHLRSPDEGDYSPPEEDAAKRRKRHHHHRRRHGKHSLEEEDDEMESAKDSAPSDAPPLLPPPSVHVDDEREEGEILDDDDGEPVDGGRGVGRRSDSAYGEIVARAVDDSYPDPMFSGEEDKLICERTKVSTPTESELGVDDMVESGPSLVRSGITNESKNDGNGTNGVAHAWSTHDKAHRAENNGIGLRMETTGRRSKSPEREVGNEKKHRSGDRKDSKRQRRSRSPISEERLHARKHLRKDDQSIDASERTLAKKKSSASPRSSRDKYNPSSSSQHHESGHRDQSRSYEKGFEPSGDGNHRDVQVYPLDILRNDYGRSDKIDGYPNRIETSDKDTYRKRERSSSYSRHDERHRSREREREKERGRQNSVRDRDNMDVDRRAHGERETRSYSRHERRQSQERGRERERDLYGGSTRGSHKDRSIDTRGDKYKDKERSKDSDHRRSRDRSDTDNNRAKEREVSVHKGREDYELIERHQTGSRDRRRDSRHSNYDETERRKEKRRPKELSNDAGSGREHTAGAREQSIREEDVDDYEEKIEQQLVKQDEEDIDKIKEESRKRRQAIMEKYRQRQRQRQQQEQEQQHLVESSSDGNKKGDEASLEENLQGSSTTNVDNQAVKDEVQNEQENVDVYVADPSFTVNKSPLANGASPGIKESTNHGLGEGSPKSEGTADMFTDDIFGESPAVRKMGKDDGPKMDQNFLHDNWDDAEGYYSYRFGEVLDGRYEVISAHGKGVFSTVVRAKDLKAGRGDPEEVAIKIIRNNETMYKAGRDELVILKKLAGADPEDKRHCVRFISSFKYRNHLCLVFESLHMNLREVLKKFGRNIGLKLTGVRTYAKQLFIALKHLRNCGVLHCDIKPDNMLVNESKNVLKLCDFGNAMFAGKNEITPYLVSRFYRAPEIILGLPYDHPMDIWSVGCCLYELYTGKVLFPGPSNNDMLRLHMELKGAFPKKMLRKGAFVYHHFDQDLNFHSTEEDPVTKKAVKRLLLNIKPKDISVLISGSPGDDTRMLANFKDLLEQIFILDPEKRMTVNQALSHPFITEK